MSETELEMIGTLSLELEQIDYAAEAAAVEDFMRHCVPDHPLARTITRASSACQMTCDAIDRLHEIASRPVEADDGVIESLHRDIAITDYEVVSSFAVAPERSTELQTLGLDDPLVEGWAGRFSGSVFDVARKWCGEFVAAVADGLLSNGPSSAPRPQLMGSFLKLRWPDPEDSTFSDEAARRLWTKAEWPYSGLLPLNALRSKLDVDAVARIANAVPRVSDRDRDLLEAGFTRSLARLWPNEPLHASPLQARLSKPISVSVALDWFDTTVDKIKGALGRGELTDMRPPASRGKGVERRLDPRELMRLFPLTPTGERMLLGEKGVG